MNQEFMIAQHQKEIEREKLRGTLFEGSYIIVFFLFTRPSNKSLKLTVQRFNVIVIINILNHVAFI